MTLIQQKISATLAEASDDVKAMYEKIKYELGQVGSAKDLDYLYLKLKDGDEAQALLKQVEEAKEEVSNANSEDTSVSTAANDETSGI